MPDSCTFQYKIAFFAHSKTHFRWINFSLIHSLFFFFSFGFFLLILYLLFDTKQNSSQLVEWVSSVCHFLYENLYLHYSLGWMNWDTVHVTMFSLFFPQMCNVYVYNSLVLWNVYKLFRQIKTFTMGLLWDTKVVKCNRWPIAHGGYFIPRYIYI